MLHSVYVEGYRIKTINSIYLIASNELLKNLKNPVIAVVGAILLLLAFFNGVGRAHDLQLLELYGSVDIKLFFVQGIAQALYSTSLICGIMSAFIGVMSISEERFKSTLNVLLTKPLTRFDIFMGKILGISTLMLLFIVPSILLTAIMLIFNIGEPLSIDELSWRLLAYIFSLVFACSLVAGLSMMIGVLFKNVIGATSIVITYLYVDWINNMVEYLGNISVISPYMLYFKLISPIPAEISIFNVNTTFNSWFSNALPYVALMLIELLIASILGAFAFIKQDSQY